MGAGRFYGRGGTLTMNVCKARGGYRIFQKGEFKPAIRKAGGGGGNWCQRAAFHMNGGGGGGGPPPPPPQACAGSRAALRPCAIVHCTYCTMSHEASVAVPSNTVHGAAKMWPRRSHIRNKLRNPRGAIIYFI